MRGPIGDATQDMDVAVGVLMAAVRSEPKVATSTLVFFTSDNGSPQRPDGNLPLRGYKASICTSACIDRLSRVDSFLVYFGPVVGTS